MTGGAGLYGRQIVDALAEAGAKVFVAARSRAALEEFASSRREQGLDVEALTYDQGDEKSILALREELLGRVDKLDVLVNNAVLRPMKEGYQSDAETFAQSMHVNATGLFIITRAFGDEMAKQKSGSIINIGSIQGVCGEDTSLYVGTDMMHGMPDYYFHKGGVTNFTRFIASYYGASQVRCNCVIAGGFSNNQPEPFL
ncbi:MAG: SDR family NAD(P)-dependent oxidoreductase, partial [Abditibacteriaceae bacterium]